MLSLFTAAALAASPPPVVGGQETDAWPASAMLSFRQGASETPLCSGVLVAEDAVLSAAHCARDLQELADVGLDIIVSFDGVEREILEIVAHPDWDPQTFQDDLALFAIEPVDDIEPVSFSSEDPHPRWTGEGLTAVGYGDADEVGGGAGIKRVLALEVVEVDADFIRLDAAGDANLCSGDSGGPVFREVEGTWQLAGISAFIFRDDGESGCTGGSTAAVRADRAAAWVDAVRAGEAWDGIWSSPVGNLPPASGGCAAAPIGGGLWLPLLVLARRRQR